MCCCALIEEGRFGVRSIRLENPSFNCKLTWDILKGNGLVVLLRKWYFKETGEVKKFHRASSLWSGISVHATRLGVESMWLIGRHSKINF